MRALLLTVAATVIVVAAPAAATAADWRPLGTAVEAAQSDGVRWTAWLKDDHSVVVRDDLHGRRATFELGPTCPHASRLLVGPGVGLVRCAPQAATSASALAVVGLRDGVVRLVPGVTSEELLDRSFTQVGSRWAEFEQQVNRSTIRGYLDLTTGAERSLERARAVPDLSSPDLAQPLCDPVRRPADPYLDGQSDEGPAFGFVRQTGRWLVFPAADRVGRVLIRAWRCGARRSIRLAACPRLDDTCPLPNAGAGIVSWSEDRRARVVALRRPGRVLSVPAPVQDADRVLSFSVEQTRRRLYGSVTTERGALIFRRPVPRSSRPSDAR